MMAMAAAVGSLVSMAMGLASEMDPEETEYLACPTIADDSLAHQNGCRPRRTQKCDCLRRTPGRSRDYFYEPAAYDYGNSSFPSRLAGAATAAVAAIVVSSATCQYIKSGFFNSLIPHWLSDLPSRFTITDTDTSTHSQEWEEEKETL